MKVYCLVFFTAVCVAACSGGGSDGAGSSSRYGADSANFGCSGGCFGNSLTPADVTIILQQGVAAAAGLHSPATIAITDRVGNVLALYAMAGAPTTTAIGAGIGAAGGLEGVAVPAAVAAISKAGTGAFLSSQGNAFTTRTASQIIQEHFDPGENNQPAGPLFGVQFSQLMCGDVTTVNPALLGGIRSGSKFRAGGNVGPRPLPLGLSADPGGIPIYKSGEVVGGLGVEADGAYRIDRDIGGNDDDIEERIALSAARGGFEIPSERVGDLLFVAGRTLRSIDLSYDQLDALPQTLPDLAAHGSFVTLPFYSDGQVHGGAVFGTSGSGVLRGSRMGIASAILVDGAGGERFPTRAGTPLAGGGQLSPTEVAALLDSALLTAHRSRAAIRRPLDSDARVSIWVVDTAGVPLGMTRSEDAPVFGLDVALQKARTAAFFSSKDAAAKLDQVRFQNGIGSFENYVAQSEALLGPGVFSVGFAFTSRAIGNIARPFFLDGIEDNGPGPLSLPFPGRGGSSRSWSPFNVGLQLDIVFQRLVQPLGIPANPPTSIPDSCTDTSALGSRLRNGLQIFAGSVPLYRNGVLVGALGVSGDGTSQDDLIAFYGASRPGLDAAGHNSIGDATLGFNAPQEIRSDTINAEDPDARLRYVSCPEAAFIGSDEQDLCSGL